jgi:hypothetical protein
VGPFQNGGEAPSRTWADPALLKAMTEAERIERGCLDSLLRLTSLAQNLVEAILVGQAAEVALPNLLEPFSMNWAEQRSAVEPDPGPELDGVNRPLSLEGQTFRSVAFFSEA